MRSVEFLKDLGGTDLFRVIVESMPTPLLVTDSRCRVVLVNRAAEMLFRYSEGEMLDSRAELLVPPHLRPQFTELLLHPDEESGARAAAQRELRILRKDGSESSRIATAQSVRANADVTLLFLEEPAPVPASPDAEQRMAALVEAAEDAILTKTLDGVIRSWNPGAERLLGYSPAQVLGQSITLLLPEDRHDEEAMILDRIRRGERVEHFETIRRRQDGSHVDVSLTISPIRDRSGVVVGASKIMRDITARKRGELELRRTNEELAQSNSDLDDFVYTASHDLRSPLTSVNSVVQWILEDDRSLSPKSRERLELIRSRIGRMQGLLNDIRDYARSGRTAEVSGPLVTAAELVNGVAELSYVPPGFSVHCDPSLEGVKVHRVPTEQIFHNLIGNAIKHHDRRMGTVTVSVVSNPASLRFSIVDDGPGVPAEYKEAIFEMFKTLKPRDEVEGSGMGLALVRKIVGRYGGQCGVEPAGERGSNFWFDWPHPCQKER